MAIDKQIKNPIEWGAHRLVEMTHAIGRAADTMHVPEETDALPAVNRIGLDDVRQAIARGIDDLGAFRSDALSLAIIYPVAGIVLAVAASTHNLLPLIFPLASGFALIGPVAGIGFYALSRRREREAAGEKDTGTTPAYGAIPVVGLLLLAIFIAWLVTAYWIYLATLGQQPPQTTAAFVRDVFMTEAGRTMIVAGIGTGFLFAIAALSVGAISFPLMLDRPVGPVTAVRTSIRAATKNPGPMAAWGVIVAAGLVIGALPALIGLVIVIPLLGHATWHLYRSLVPRPGE
ncbi:DUF2189 domain-containing protein [Oricola nitratireducens]|uniref:DUF2189 domain-containing protein n=1 Tax=Oricola nitratireducens TaxID=2775868 RepID=UPI001866C063|nr:DUF2189 domain-containing protein [Oricola nitratireducens]